MVSNWTIDGVKESLAAKKISAREVTAEFYKRIDARNAEWELSIADPDRAGAVGDSVRQSREREILARKRYAFDQGPIVGVVSVDRRAVVVGDPERAGSVRDLAGIECEVYRGSCYLLCTRVKVRERAGEGVKGPQLTAGSE